MTARGCALGIAILLTAATSAMGNRSQKLIEAIVSAASETPSPIVATLAQGAIMNGILPKAKFLVFLIGLASLTGLGFSFPVEAGLISSSSVASTSSERSSSLKNHQDPDMPIEQKDQAHLVKMHMTSEPPLVERKIAKEPRYLATPYYLMLAFDPDGKETSWMVLDGELLYVDLNGNGDLTDDGGPIKKDQPKNGAPLEFAIPNITVNKKTHTDIRLYVYSLDKNSKKMTEDFGNTINTKMAESQAHLPVVVLELASARAGIPGNGRGGRVEYRCGPLDGTGILQMTEKPGDASVLHFGQQYEIRPFYINTVTAKTESSFRTVLGSPGYGPGAFAAVKYLGLLPKDQHAIAEVHYSAKKPGEKPRIEKYTFSTRTCEVNLDVNFNPGDAEGSAEVTFSYPGWTEGKVQSTTFPFTVLPRPKPGDPPPLVAKSSQYVATLPHPKDTSNTTQLKYHPDGTRLLSVTYYTDNFAQVWDVVSKKELRRIALQSGPKSTMEIACLSSDWNTLYSWEYRSKAIVREKDDRKLPFIEFSGDVKRWDMKNGQPLPDLPATSGAGTQSLWLSPDGKDLLSVEMKSSFRDDISSTNQKWVMIDTKSGTRRDWPANVFGCKPWAMPDHLSVVQLEFNSQAKQYELHIRKLSDGSSIRSAVMKRTSENTRLYLTGLSEDGKTVAICTGANVGDPITTSFHTTSNMEQIGQFDLTSKSEFMASPAYFTPDGTRYLAVDHKHRLHIYDIATKKVVRTVQLEKSAWQQAVSSDSKWFAVPYLPGDQPRAMGPTQPSASSMGQGRITLVNLQDASARPITLVGPRGNVGAVAFRPDGKELAVGGTGGVHLFDISKLVGK